MAEADDAVRVIVVTNTEFCAGADLPSIGSCSDEPPSRRTEPAGCSPGSADHRSLCRQINGHCVAGGMGLAAAMDYSVVLDTKMGFTEVRIGVAPAMISVLCLPKMRASDARAAFLRGNRFLAPEAARMGIINEAVPAHAIDTAVDAVVADLVRGSPAALAATKQLLATVPDLPIDEAFAWTAPLSAELFRGDDAAEGMAAFLEKRLPAWVPDRQREKDDR